MMDVKKLVGSGDRIGLFVLPVVVVGVILNIAFPSVFEVGGPPPVLRAVSIIVATAGIVMWIWSAVLILTKVPKGELITGGPYAIVKHPLYGGRVARVAVGRVPPEHVARRRDRDRALRRLEDLRTRGGGSDVRGLRRAMGRVPPLGVDPWDLADRAPHPWVLTRESRWRSGGGRLVHQQTSSSTRRSDTIE